MEGRLLRTQPRKKPSRVVSDDCIHLRVGHPAPALRCADRPGRHEQMTPVSFSHGFRGNEALLGAQDLCAGDLRYVSERFVVIGESNSGIGVGLLKESGKADLWIEPAHGGKGAKVKALQDEPILDLVTTDRSMYQLNKVLRRGRDRGIAGKALGLDVEEEVTLRCKVQHLVQGRHRSMRYSDLMGKVCQRVLSAVILPDLCVCEGAKQGPRWQGRSLTNTFAMAGKRRGTPAVRLSQTRRVSGDENVVFRDREVEFKYVGARLDTIAETGEGIFRSVGAASTVSVHKDRAPVRAGRRR